MQMIWTRPHIHINNVIRMVASFAKWIHLNSDWRAAFGHVDAATLFALNQNENQT